MWENKEVEDDNKEIKHKEQQKSSMMCKTFRIMAWVRDTGGENDTIALITNNMHCFAYALGQIVDMLWAMYTKLLHVTHTQGRVC